MNESPETYYTPERVEALLRRLPYLLDQPARDPEMPKSPPSHASPGGRLEEQMAKRADVEWALCQLPEFTYRVVYLSYVGGKSLRAIGGLLNCGKDTVRHHRIEGVKWMAWYLGWRDATSGWGDREAS